LELEKKGFGIRTVSGERNLIQEDKHFDFRKISSSGYSEINAAKF
jgi:hypothetical protein